MSSSAARYFPGGLRGSISTVANGLEETHVAPDGVGIEPPVEQLVQETGRARTTADTVNSHPTWSDELLVEGISKNDADALAHLFRRYARLVRGVALRILRDSSEADDLLQEVFLFIHRKCGTFDSSKSSARSWIIQMTYHRAFDKRRALQSRHFYTQVELNEAAGVFDLQSNAVIGTDFPYELVGNTTIQGLLDTLSEDQRNTLSLHFYEGYTFAEIASKLDQSLGNIRNHYYRGLEKLRKQVFPGKLSGRNGYGRK
jgi:RNA polymerase sigma-70 factor (ECF subfamily)